MRRRVWNHSGLSQSGFSLLEVLVAIGILGVLILFVAQFNIQIVSPQKLSPRRACESYAQAIVNAVQEETYYRQVSNFVPLPGARTAGQFADNGTTKAIADPTLWWTDPGSPSSFVISEIGSPNEGVRLRNFQLIQGSLRSLAAIYNNTPAVQCQYGPYNPLTSGINIPMPQDMRLLNAMALIQLRPYDRTVGIDTCTTSIYPQPKEKDPLLNNALSSAFVVESGNQVPPAANEGWMTGGTPAYPTPAPIVGTTMAVRGTAVVGSIPYTDVGIELTARVSYVPTPGGQTEYCQASQKFEYPRDRQAPPKPVVRVVDASNPSFPRPNCEANVTVSPTIQIEYMASPPEMERGFQFLCRDLSWRKYWDGNSARCVLNSSGIDSSIEPDNPDPNLQSFSSRVNQWVPCDQLSQCGSGASMVRYTDSSGAVITSPNNRATDHRLELSYPSLPQGCVMNFEVATVDTAGNTSIDGDVNNRVFLEDSASGILGENEVHHSMCGTYCTGGPANGYYTCRTGGCCVGVGCTPTSGPFP